MAVTVVCVCFCGGGVVCILGVGAVGLQLLCRFSFLACVHVSAVAESLLFTLNTDRNVFAYVSKIYLTERNPHMASAAE